MLLSALSMARLTTAAGTSRRPQWSGRLAVLAALLLSLVLAWQLVQLLWLVLAGPEVESAPVPPVPQIQPAAVGRDGYRWDLFGEAARARPLPTVVPAARTELQLRGLMSGGERAFAIIADGAGNEQVYRIGDELPDGSRLATIRPLEVLIERDGSQEALVFERELSRPSARPTPASGGSDGNRSGIDSMPGIRGLQVPAGISAASLQRPDAQVGALSDQIAVLPVAGGGYRVRPGRDATLFAELGLQVNDVVTAVNGQPLSSREDAQALFADVLRRGEVSITINRQGREMTLRPDLEQILSRIE